MRAASRDGRGRAARADTTRTRPSASADSSSWIVTPQHAQAPQPDPVAERSEDAEPQAMLVAARAAHRLPAASVRSFTLP